MFTQERKKGNGAYLQHITSHHRHLSQQPLDTLDVEYTITRTINHDSAKPNSDQISFLSESTFPSREVENERGRTLQS